MHVLESKYFGGKSSGKYTHKQGARGASEHVRRNPISLSDKSCQRLHCLKETAERLPACHFRARHGDKYITRGFV